MTSATLDLAKAVKAFRSLHKRWQDQASLYEVALRKLISLRLSHDQMRNTLSILKTEFSNAIASHGGGMQPTCTPPFHAVGITTLRRFSRDLEKAGVHTLEEQQNYSKDLDLIDCEVRLAQSVERVFKLVQAPGGIAVVTSYYVLAGAALALATHATHYINAVNNRGNS